MRVITTAACALGVAALMLAPSSRAAAQGTRTDTTAAARTTTTAAGARTHRTHVASTRHVRVRKDYGGTANGEVMSTDTTGAAAARRPRANPAATTGTTADSAATARPNLMRDSSATRDSAMTRDSTMKRDSTMRRDSTARRDSSGTGAASTTTGDTTGRTQPPRRPPEE